jgi:hypothetical protein
MKQKITQKQVTDLLHYDPDTGAFTWRLRSREYFKDDRSWKIWNTRFAGRKAGAEKHNKTVSYLVIAIDGKTHYAHRLAWIYMVGSMPEKDVDHKDCNGLNNRWDNLRAATRSQNMANRRGRKNPTGIKGVIFCKRDNIYKVQIGKEGRYHHIGSYKTPELAQTAYSNAATEFFGEFARTA